MFRVALFYFNFWKKFFFFFRLWWVFVAMSALPYLQTRDSHRSGFFCCAAWAPAHWGFRSCSSRALEHRRRSWGARAQSFHGMWDPPGSGIEPTSPAFAGQLSTTEPPGKPQIFYYELAQWVKMSLVRQSKTLLRSLTIQILMSPPNTREMYSILNHTKNYKKIGHILTLSF